MNTHLAWDTLQPNASFHNTVAMIAKVIPLGKRLPARMGVFDYTLPKELEHVEPGFVVEIPFRQKTMLGIVMAVEMNPPEGTLKPVVRLLSPKPLLQKEELTFLTHLAAWYGVSPATIATFMLPPLQKRKLQQTTLHLPHTKEKNTEIQHPQFATITNSDELVPYIQTKRTEQKTVCVFVPEIFLLKKYAEHYRAKTGEHATEWHSEQTTKQSWDAWISIREGTAPVVFATRSGAFLPLPKNTVIILTDEAHSEYKHSDQNPRYHVKDVLDIRQKYIPAQRVYAGSVPSLDTYYGLYHGTIDAGKTLTKEDRFFTSPTLPMLDVVDMHNDRRAGHYGVLSDAVKERIAHTNGDMYIAVTRRGFMGTVGCVTCNTIRRCPTCENPLVLHDDTNELVCHYCRTRTALTPQCPTCHSPSLRYSGAGTAFVENGVRALVSHRDDVEVVRVDTDYIPELKETNQHRIVVGTEKAIPFLRHSKVNTIVFVDLDTTLHVPEFRMHEDVWTNLHGLAALCPGATIVVQTFSPEHIIFSAKKEPDRFYRTELSARADLGYPPYTTLVRLLYSSPQKDDAKDAPKKLVERLKTLLTNESKESILQGPFELHPAFLRGEYWSAIILKIPPAHTHVVPRIVDILPGKGWRVDINPNRLLSV